VSQPTPAPWYDTEGRRTHPIVTSGGLHDAPRRILSEEDYQFARQRVNAHRSLSAVLRAAYHALKSYEHGNGSPDLAAQIAREIHEVIGNEVV
jgi:hypothetical protein